MPAELTIKQLEVTYQGQMAVSDLTLDVAGGELVALLGPSGCGKTTTLRAIAGFERPSAGRIRIGGTDVTDTPGHARNVGVVFQSYALFPHLTVRDNVAFGLRMRGVARRDQLERTRAMLDLVGLAPFEERYPAQLSGGQQQRVALARALVIKPAVLLLDEPLSNLDAHLRGTMRSEIRNLQKRLGITTIFVTHDQEEALAISDRVCVMRAGKLVAVDTPQGLCDRPGDPGTAAFLGRRSLIEGRTVGGVFTAAGLTCSGAPEGARQIVLRAARLGLDGEGGALTVSGEVLSRAYLGDAFEIGLATPAGPVLVVVDSAHIPPAVGQTCRITARPDAVSFIA